MYHKMKRGWNCSRCAHSIVSGYTTDTKRAMIGNWPKNITELIWSAPAAVDSENVRLLCRVSTGAYVFYSGRHNDDSSQFVDYWSNHDIVVSPTLADLVQNGMPAEVYAQYMEKTKPASVVI